MKFGGGRSKGKEGDRRAPQVVKRRGVGVMNSTKRERKKR